MSETVRVFIAIEITKKTQDELANLAGLYKDPHDKVTWVAPNNIHLTLKFLGNVPEKDIDRIKDVLSDLSKRYSRFEAEVKGLGVFPSEKSPRVVWAGVDKGRENIKSICGDLEEKLAQIGFPKEERGFTPHFTLGRVKYIKDTKKFAEKISTHKSDFIDKIDIKDISLIKSKLTPEGSVYEALYRAEFKTDNSTV